jgi:hypothetical protein
MALTKGEYRPEHSIHLHSTNSPEMAMADGAYEHPMPSAGAGGGPQGGQSQSQAQARGEYAYHTQQMSEKGYR